MIRLGQRTAGAFGAVLVACGVLLNVWTLSLLSADGVLQGSTVAMIWLFDVACVLLGALLIKHRSAIAARGLGVLGRPLAITYLLVSVLSFTGLLVFVVLNVIATPVSRLIQPDSAKLLEVQETLERITGMSSADRGLLNAESVGWQFEPWVGFRERPRQGVYVNVTEAGFRPTHRRELTLDDDGLQVFVFGGSTTFGYGVDDASTIPAYLQRHLSAAHPGVKINVFNFGRGYYYSSQEMVFLLQLAKSGRAPAIAVFIDGVNEGQAEPHYGAEMRWMYDIFNSADAVPLVDAALERLPLSALVKRWTGQQDRFQTMNRYMALTPAEVYEQYVQSKGIVMALAERYSFTPYFFIQPVPGYKNDFLHHPLQTQDYLQQYEFTLEKIELMEQTVDDATTFSMTHLLGDYAGEPYLDSIHYVADVHDLLAKFIADRIRIR